MSVTTARNWTEGKRVDSVEEVVVREVEVMSARTMRVQPSWANAVAVALPMPVFFVGMRFYENGSQRVLPEDAPVIRATPGKRVEDMVSRSRGRENEYFENIGTELWEYLDGYVCHGLIDS
jgi:hypothetical protein